MNSVRRRQLFLGAVLAQVEFLDLLCRKVRHDDAPFGGIQIIATGDFLQLWGNGNNTIFDVGINDTIYLAGDGNNLILNWGPGSYTHILAGMGKNYVYGPFGP